MIRAIAISSALVPMLADEDYMHIVDTDLKCLGSIGRITSPMTSTIMHSGPRMNQAL